MTLPFDENLKRVKAVGFAFMSPEVILLFGDHSRHYFHLFPLPKKSLSKTLDFSGPDRTHIVLLRAVDRLHGLEPYVNKIYRLVIFGKPEELTLLTVPIIDAIVIDGVVVPGPRQTKDVTLARIEGDAVEISVDAIVSPKGIKKVSKEMSSVEKKSVTLIALLRGIRDVVKDQEGVNFAQDFGAPTVFKITGDISPGEFKTVCKLLTEHKVPEEQARSLYTWVMGFTGSGTDLAAAVEKYLHPRRTILDMDEYVTFLAEEHKVDIDDICFVANSYKDLIARRAVASPQTYEEPDSNVDVADIDQDSTNDNDDFGLHVDESDAFSSPDYDQDVSGDEVAEVDSGFDSTDLDTVGTDDDFGSFH